MQCSRWRWLKFSIGKNVTRDATKVYADIIIYNVDDVDAFADHLGIRRKQRFENDEEARVAGCSRRALASDPEGFIVAYRETFGKVFNADDASELFSEYAASTVCRSKYHSTIHSCSRWVRDKAFERALAEPDSPEMVVFMSGGSAAGKSTVAPSIALELPVLVYDTTLSVLDGARQKINEVLELGKRAYILYIDRDIEDAFNANLDRAMGFLGGGRVTSIDSMIRTHKGAAETVSALAKEFVDHPRISVGGIPHKAPFLIGDLNGVVREASKRYGGKAEELVRDFPQYDRRVSHVFM